MTQTMHSNVVGYFVFFFLGYAGVVNTDDFFIHIVGAADMHLRSIILGEDKILIELFAMVTLPLIAQRDAFFYFFCTEFFGNRYYIRRNCVITDIVCFGVI